jgi:hypothetical protein
MGDLHLLQLDKDIARAARAERAWLRAVRADAVGAADDAWFEPQRHVTTRTTFQQIAELPKEDPFREPMLAWVYRLALTRIARGHILAAASVRQKATFTTDKPERGTFSARSLVARVLGEKDINLARVWSLALGETGPAGLVAERTLRQAEIEITGRLGAAELALDSPYERATLLEEANRFMARTDDVTSALFGQEKDLVAVVERLVARDVPGVWPTRSHARWLSDQFPSSDLLDGLSLDLGSPPATLGAASFARTLARFGAAYARAAASSGAAFVHAHDPTDAHPLRRGALFASLLGDPVYLRKQLGFSRDASEKAARSLAVTFLAEARLAATRSLADFALSSGTQIQELVEHALFSRVPTALSGVLPRPCRSAALRLAAILLAADDREALRARFDDDWFRNPRALFALRERDEAFRWARQPKEMLEGSAERLSGALEESVG